MKRYTAKFVGSYKVGGTKYNWKSLAIAPAAVAIGLILAAICTAILGGIFEVIKNGSDDLLILSVMAFIGVAVITAIAAIKTEFTKKA